jgi:AmiR/NasT family two-component response regulator
MERRRLEEQDAFELLRRRASGSNPKLADLAAAVVETCLLAQLADPPAAAGSGWQH